MVFVITHSVPFLGGITQEQLTFYYQNMESLIYDRGIFAQYWGGDMHVPPCALSPTTLSINAEGEMRY